MIRCALVTTCLLASTFAPLAGATAAGVSLATPVTTELQAEPWPMSIAVEIVAKHDDSEPIAKREVVVPDGHRSTWSSTVWSAHGRRHIDLAVVAHQHPGSQVELEWDLAIEREPVLEMPLADYVLHRLRLGAGPQLGARALEVSRADIVSTMGEPVVETVEVGDESYEIRIVAAQLRG
jgi:hypothetical protein